MTHQVPSKLSYSLCPLTLINSLARWDLARIRRLKRAATLSRRVCSWKRGHLGIVLKYKEVQESSMNQYRSTLGV